MPIRLTPSAPADQRTLLQQELAQYLRLEADAAATIGYHDKRRQGLIGTLEVYTALKEQVQAQLLALDNS